MAARNIFEIFGEGIPPLPLDVINAEQEKLKQKQAAKEYQVVPPKAESKSFSFSSDNPTSQPDLGLKSDEPEAEATVLDKSISDATGSDSAQQPDCKKESVYMSILKSDFSSLIQDAENISNVALALEEMLTKDSVRWIGMAHILSEQLRNHVECLKNLAL